MTTNSQLKKIDFWAAIVVVVGNGAVVRVKIWKTKARVSYQDQPGLRGAAKPKLATEDEKQA